MLKLKVLLWDVSKRAQVTIQDWADSRRVLLEQWPVSALEGHHWPCPIVVGWSTDEWDLVGRFAQASQVTNCDNIIAVVGSNTRVTDALRRLGASRQWHIESRPESLTALLDSLLLRPPLNSGVRPLTSGAELDLKAKCIRTREGETVALTPQKFAILAYLTEHPGECISCQDLVRAGVLLGSQSYRYRSIVRELRSKLASLAPVVVTIPGHGYMFTPQTDEGKDGRT